MALTLTERFRYGAGGRKFLYLSVTHDELTSTFTAASVEMNLVEHLADLGRYGSSDTANTSVLLYTLTMTILAGGRTVDIGYPMNAGSKTHLLLIGW